MKKITRLLCFLSLFSLIIILAGCFSDSGKSSTYNGFYDYKGNKISADLVTSGTVTANNRTVTVNVYVDHSLNTADAKTAAAAVLDKFVGNGGTESIYGWVSSIYGAEWGSTNYSNLITDTNTISILMFDIDGDGTNGTNGSYVVGYFYSRDNFTKSSAAYSNQKIMFSLDLPYMLRTAGTESTWTSSGAYPKKIYSTLAHEFQHMIHFYQKDVVYTSDGDSAWLDEMCSAATEDFVADKLQVEGPRGVLDVNSVGTSPITIGRLPLFNLNNDDSLTTWGSELKDYSSIYAFGAFLSRNFGGPALFKNMVQTATTDMTAVTSAVTSVSGSTETLETLLRQWGAAVVLSDSLTVTGNIKYNSGTSAISKPCNGVSYNLGPINLYNYVLTSSSNGSVLQSGPYFVSSILSALYPTLSSVFSASAADADVIALSSVPGKPEITEKNKEFSKMLANSNYQRFSEEIASVTSLNPSITADSSAAWTVIAADEVRYIGSSSLTITPKTGGNTIYFIVSNTNETSKNISISGGYTATSLVNPTSNTYYKAGNITTPTVYTFALQSGVVVTAVAR